MKRLFFTILSISQILTFSLFAEEPDIEVVSVALRLIDIRDERLTNRKDLVKLAFSEAFTISNSNEKHKSSNYSAIKLKIAFISKLKRPRIKKMYIEPVNIGKNKSMEFHLLNDSFHDNKILVGDLISDKVEDMTITEIGKIKGKAILEEFHTINIEIKNILSLACEKFDNEKLKELGIDLKIKDLKPETKEISFFTKNENLLTGDFFKFTNLNREALSGMLYIAGDSFEVDPIAKEADYDITIEKEELTKDSSLILSFTVPEKEITVPFTLKNIKVPK